MILLSILALTVLILIVFIVAACSVGGAVMTILFGDVIVCIGGIVALIVYLVKKRRNH